MTSINVFISYYNKLNAIIKAAVRGWRIYISLAINRVN